MSIKQIFLTTATLLFLTACSPGVNERHSTQETTYYPSFVQQVLDQNAIELSRVASVKTLENHSGLPRLSRYRRLYRSIDYNSYVRFTDCGGHLVIQHSYSGVIKQVYSRGDCHFLGIRWFN
ncbi:hypothetical protein O4H49_07480 [Kiloniella laminariae]|uniref:Lipoprotein n=1 Tax=Kiloniella laminariae TaxID=454162 RepID=A0ABT4LHP6_9PROT|nr:hypothetical protein [Kiloniella laminariae]MCZ4280614.1 hypothetical protein [Kiloniella laminariae]